MEIGDVVHDRFEVIGLLGPEGMLRDRVTGRRALTLRPGFFLDEASSFAMASHVRTLDARDLAEVLALNPTVLALGEDEGKPNPVELAHLTLDLIERCFSLLEEGVVAQPHRAWVVRRDEGWTLRLPAGLVGIGSFHRPTLEASAIIETLVGRCMEFFWHRHPVRRRTHAHDPARIAGVLAKQVRDPSVRTRKLRRPQRVWERRDLADAERRGRAALGQPRADGSHVVDLVSLPLASLLHHQACVAAHHGDRVLALARIDEALGLDPHARYFTTRALLLESRGEDEEARVAHEAAVRALANTFLVPSVTGERFVDHNESVHDPRTAHAYGAFLARRGQLEQAVVWLRHATRPQPAWLGVDPFAASRHAALAVVLFRLGQRDEARTVAARALSIDAEEPSARAVLTVLDRA